MYQSFLTLRLPLAGMTESIMDRLIKVLILASHQRRTNVECTLVIDLGIIHMRHVRLVHRYLTQAWIIEVVGQALRRISQLCHQLPCRIVYAVARHHKEGVVQVCKRLL